MVRNAMEKKFNGKKCYGVPKSMVRNAMEKVNGKKVKGKKCHGEEIQW